METRTVLVIEENEMSMKLIRTVLQINGNYEVFEAMDAEDGIEMARKCKPDIILMDVMLPKIDGFEATRMIKIDSELKDIPVIAVTAHAMPRDKENALEAGCVGYIAKPIDVRSFVSTMEQFMIAPKTTMI